MNVLSVFASLIERVGQIGIDIPPQKLDEIRKLWKTKYTHPQNNEEKVLTAKQF